MHVKSTMFSVKNILIGRESTLVTMSCHFADSSSRGATYFVPGESLRSFRAFLTRSMGPYVSSPSQHLVNQYQDERGHLPGMSKTDGTVAPAIARAVQNGHLHQIGPRYPEIRGATAVGPKAVDCTFLA